MLKPIILASTSIYRQELLKRTGLVFNCQQPDYDEEIIKIELHKSWADARTVAETLALGKAKSIQNTHATVVAADQLIHFNNHILGKPHSFGKAYDQLSQLNGRTHELITSTVVISGAEAHTHTNVTTLKMKNLSSQEIKKYLKMDEPFDCAGSYKIESYGIALFEKIETDDFTAIQGMPLIWLTNVLKDIGYELFER